MSVKSNRNLSHTTLRFSLNDLLAISVSVPPAALEDIII